MNVCITLVEVENVLIEKEVTNVFAEKDSEDMVIVALVILQFSIQITLACIRMPKN